MEDSEQEPEGFGEAPPRTKRRMTKIIALIIGLAVVGSSLGVWQIFFSNTPPVAAFSASAVDLRLVVSAEASTDDGEIVLYQWDWGDGRGLDTGIRAAHDYADEGTYTVALTIRDNRGASSTTSQPVQIRVVPTAFFIARQEQMKVSVDATGSFVSTGQPITRYEWNFNDGATETGLAATHTYTTPGRYKIELKVTDSLGREGIATRFVTPAATTVDVLVDQFFEAGCGYKNYWSLRYQSYGDFILRNTTPCTSYYPWVLFSSAVELQRVNPSYLYGLYRFDALVRNHPEYNLSEPVFLPVLDRSIVPDDDSYIDLDLSFEYLDTPLINQLSGTLLTPNDKYSDGFGYLLRGNLTMDLTTSKRIFGVRGDNPAAAQAWWWDNRTGTGPAPRDPGPVETAVGAWLEENGNGKYDIYNGFEWFYETDVTHLNGTVDPETGETRVNVFWNGFGLEVLLARWFYWGNASYRDAVCVKGDDPNCAATLDYGAIEPRGWLPMETCWCEQARISGRIGKSLDLNYTAIQGYSFMGWGNWGRDKLPNTRDDLPAWILAPTLMDYVPRVGSGSTGASGYQYSELRWYERLRSVHGSPGSYSYGRDYEVMVAPARWVLDAGSVLTVVLPRFDVPWYDPFQSKWSPEEKIGNYRSFDSPLTLRYICATGGDLTTCSSSPEGSYYLWDSRGKVLSIANPQGWGTDEMPLSPSPWIELAPEVSRPAQDCSPGPCPPA